MAYLLGVLPRGYTLSSLEALKKEGSLNVQAGTAFVDFEFLEEVSEYLFFLSLQKIPYCAQVSNKISKSSLDL